MDSTTMPPTRSTPPTDPAGPTPPVPGFTGPVPAHAFRTTGTFV